MQAISPSYISCREYILAGYIHDTECSPADVFFGGVNYSRHNYQIQILQLDNDRLINEIVIRIADRGVDEGNAAFFAHAVAFMDMAENMVPGFYSHDFFQKKRASHAETFHVSVQNLIRRPMSNQNIQRAWNFIPNGFQGCGSSHESPIHKLGRKRAAPNAHTLIQHNFAVHQVVNVAPFESA